MWNKIIKCFLFLLCLDFCSCKMDFNFGSGNEVDFAGSNCWMSKIDDNKLIRELTIPGTHDTCANYDFAGLSSTASAQDLSLKQQLEAGVRQIDIRLYGKGKDYTIHHGITYLHKTYDEVLSDCYEFLDKNPTETIIMLIKSEWLCTDADICFGVENGIDKNPDRWIVEKSAENLKLGDCRNKIVLVKRFNGLPGIGISGGNSVGSLHQYDGYKTSDLDEYCEQIIKDLNKNMNEINMPFVSMWTACYFEGQFGIPNIRIVSSRVNPLLEKYLDGDIDGINKKYSKVHLGMIGTDHITKRLAYKIYCVNLNEGD